jgi:cytochrome c556
MRYFAMLLIGLFTGSLGAVAAMSALKSDVPYNDAIMVVMKHQMGAMHGMHESGKCDATEANHRIALLGAAASDVDAAFLPVGDDAKFKELSGKLRQAIATAQATPRGDCAALKKTMGDIGQHCKACHDVFR